MDSSTDWTASALFSPSKARAQQAQARDWAAVDSWLSKKYPGRRVPEFERNEETLQVLLTLATLNDAADEQRVQVDRVEKAALQSISKRSHGFADDTLRALVNNLSHEDHLDMLAETAVALGCPIAESTAIGTAVVDLTSAAFETQQQLARTSAQLSALKSEQTRIKAILQELRGDDFQASSQLAEQTAEWTRSAKQLKAKIAEYDERLNSARPASSAGNMSLLQHKAEQVARQQARLGDLEVELQAFQDLPSDSRVARAQVEQAREELRRLSERRDRLFEGMVESG